MLRCVQIYGRRPGVPDSHGDGVIPSAVPTFLMRAFLWLRNTHAKSFVAHAEACGVLECECWLVARGVSSCVGLLLSTVSLLAYIIKYALTYQILTATSFSPTTRKVCTPDPCTDTPSRREHRRSNRH